MSFATAREHSTLGVLISVLVFAPSISSQEIPLNEFRNHLPAAMQEVVGKRQSDQLAVERASKVLLPPSLLPADKIWDKKLVTHGLAEAIRREDLGLTFRKKHFEFFDKPPKELDATLALKTGGLFVDSLSSVIRRMSILEEIGPVIPGSSITTNFAIA